MKFREFGVKSNKAVILLHGGGLSWWSLTPHIEALKDDYFVIASTIDGHGDDSENTFITIENCANEIIEYIDNNLDGKVYGICGLSIGAQIAIEIMSRNKDIVQKAIIESGLVHPMKSVAALVKPMYSMSYGLIKQRWFSKYQAKALFVSDDMFENYYEDSCKMSKESLINMTISNSNYSMPESLKDSNAEAIVLVGSKELSAMKKSAKLLNNTIKNSTLKILDKNGHGEFSLKTTEKYTTLVAKFLN